jgi:isoprenylcysteine carboxyl methyltransferase (ICMT) family protein YpbQ
VFTILNAAVLAIRIRVETQALSHATPPSAGAVP